MQRICATFLNTIRLDVRENVPSTCGNGVLIRWGDASCVFSGSVDHRAYGNTDCVFLAKSESSLSFLTQVLLIGCACFTYPNSVLNTQSQNLEVTPNPFSKSAK